MSTSELDPKTMITLVSADGDEFVVEYGLVSASSMLRRMLNSKGNFLEQRTQVIKLSMIPTSTLERVLEYCKHRRRHVGSSNPETGYEEMPTFEIKSDEALELLLASSFLDI